MKSMIRPYVFLSVACCLAAVAFGQGSAVSGRVNLVREGGPGPAAGPAGVVVWLTLLSGAPAVEPGERSGTASPRIVQRNKRFETRLLAVEVGAVVEFPNLDPFFHNVFSLFDGKRFDLGLYEAGSTRSVRFDRPGVCYIFCNIHSQMSATVVVVDSPYFVVLDAPGDFRIPGPPPGRYRLNIWAERCSPETLSQASREIVVGGGATAVGTIDLEQSREVIEVHSNKYGRDYDTPVFSSPIYTQP